MSAEIFRQTAASSGWIEIVRVDVAVVDAINQFLLCCNTDATQHLPCHLTKKALDHMQSGPGLWCKDKKNMQENESYEEVLSANQDFLKQKASKKKKNVS